MGRDKKIWDTSASIQTAQRLYLLLIVPQKIQFIFSLKIFVFLFFKFYFWGIFLIYMYVYITGFVICVPKLLCQMETGFVKLCLLPYWVLYFLLTFYLSNYCLDETCHSHIWPYTLFFVFFFFFGFGVVFFFAAFVWYRYVC